MQTDGLCFFPAPFLSEKKQLHCADLSKYVTLIFCRVGDLFFFGGDSYAHIATN